MLDRDEVHAPVRSGVGAPFDSLLLLVEPRAKRDCQGAWREDVPRPREQEPPAHQ